MSMIALSGDNIFWLSIIVIIIGLVSLKIPLSGFLGFLISFAILLPVISSIDITMQSLVVSAIFVNAICTLLGLAFKLDEMRG